MTVPEKKHGADERPEAASAGTDPIAGVIPEQTKAIRERVGRAAKQRKTLARQVKIEIPAATIEEFLEKADSLGFSNFKHADPTTVALDAFNGFMNNNLFVIRNSLLAYSRIPEDWLERNNSPVPKACVTSRRYAAAIMNALTRDGFKLHMTDSAGGASNYYKFCDLFDALRALVRYRNSQAGR